MRSRRACPERSRRDPLPDCGALALARRFHHYLALSSAEPEPFRSYGTLSLASSDRPLSFPRKSTADTE